MSESPKALGNVFEAMACDLRVQRDELANEIEECHRRIDIHFGLNAQTVAVDTLSIRVDVLIKICAAARRIDNAAQNLQSLVGSDTTQNLIDSYEQEMAESLAALRMELPEKHSRLSDKKTDLA